jgi:hypothetical protein
MTLKINSASYQRTEDGRLNTRLQGNDAAQQARQLLHNMALELVNSKGQVRRGYLKLTPAEGDTLRLGTRWSTRADNSTSDAVNYVKSLVEQGFGNTMVSTPAVKQALDNYLNAKKGDRPMGDRLGTLSFVKLVRDLESTAQLNPRSDRLERANIQRATLVSKDFEGDFSSFKSEFQEADSDIARVEVMKKLWDSIADRGENAYLTAILELPWELRESQKGALSAMRPTTKIGQQYPLANFSWLREGEGGALVESQRDLDLQGFVVTKGIEQAAIKHLGITAEEYLSITKRSYPPGEGARAVFARNFFDLQPRPRHPISEKLRSDLIEAFDRASTLDGFYAEAQILVRAAQEEVKQLDIQAQPLASEQAAVRPASGEPVASEQLKFEQEAP